MFAHCAQLPCSRSQVHSDLQHYRKFLLLSGHAMCNHMQRTKEEVWLHRLRDMLTTEIGSSEAIAKPETLALANATTD